MNIKIDSLFWQTMMELADSSSIILDRPRGSAHPRFADMIYPLDYGYLENRSASDGRGIDVWLGSRNEKTLTGILCTFDRLKRDAEIKLLIGCTLANVETIQGFNSDMATLFIPNPMVEYDLSR
jgi:inorganic pyrophosphatase